MRIAICDDNEDERKHYAAFAEAIGRKRGINLTITAHANSDQLMFAADDPEMRPDIALLDVLMPKTNGVDVGKALRSMGYEGIIIYLTHSEEYAIPAYDVEAFSYVLKGGEKSDERFEKVFGAALDKVQQRQSKRIMVNNISEHRNIPIDDITYFESDRHVIKVHYGFESTFEFISSISKMENRLLSYGFVRIQRSYLVNRAAIESYNAKQVRLFDGTVLAVGRGRYPELNEAMESMRSIDIDEKPSDLKQADA